MLAVDGQCLPPRLKQESYSLCARVDAEFKAIHLHFSFLFLVIAPSRQSSSCSPRKEIAILILIHSAHVRQTSSCACDTAHV